MAITIGVYVYLSLRVDDVRLFQYEINHYLTTGVGKVEYGEKANKKMF